MKRAQVALQCHWICPRVIVPLHACPGGFDAPAYYQIHPSALYEQNRRSRRASAGVLVTAAVQKGYGVQGYVLSSSFMSVPCPLPQ